MKYSKFDYYLLGFVVFVLAVFSPFLLLGKLPIPSDALVGLYQPWRDAFVSAYPQGYPYKNWLITDPIRQQYPYRLLAIAQLKNLHWPNWNPYSFSGTPLFANIQTAALYPLNILFLFLNPDHAWSFLIVLEPLLAGIFTFFYLVNLGIDRRAATLGAVSFAFCGFMVAWLTWNTIGHVALWMPLILLAKDKLINKFEWKWAAALVFAESAMILGGHLQTALYVLVFTTIYLWVRIWQKSRGNSSLFWRKCILFVLTGACAILITSVQWWPTIHFILASGRQFDLPDWHRPDWFLPWQHLAQLVAPDYFGNPATGNYWGVFNYGEFVSFVGVIPLLLSLVALFWRRDKKTLFYGLALFLSLFLALPTFIGVLPYKYQIPFLSTLQPSRIIVLVDFVLAVLAAFGLDYLLKLKKIPSCLLIFMIGSGILIFGVLWLTTLPKTPELIIAQKNLLFPSLLFICFTLFMILKYKKPRLFELLLPLLLLLVALDMGRFMLKFTPFIDHKLLYPSTSTIEFLQHNLSYNRFMTNDRILFPPNVSSFYKLQNVDGYDPLYLKNYGGVVAAWTRQKPDITPAAFNRILTPGIIETFWKDLLGVKYLVTPFTIKNPDFKLVFEEGKTKTYENLTVFPRAFLTEAVSVEPTESAVVESMYKKPQALKHIAFTSTNVFIKPAPLLATESAQIVRYEENQVTLKTITTGERVLILSDIFYPEWKVFVNGSQAKIFPVDYALRGVIVPAGESTVEFRYN